MLSLRDPQEVRTRSLSQRLDTRDPLSADVSLTCQAASRAGHSLLIRVDPPDPRSSAYLPFSELEDSRDTRINADAADLFGAQRPDAQVAPSAVQFAIRRGGLGHGVFL
jgi:hypothetical protein